MFKTILTTLIIFVASIASAQEESGYFYNKADCMPKYKLKRILESNYNETPVLIGNASAMNVDGKSYEGLMLLYTNFETTSYTVVLYFDESDTSCVMLTGSELQPTEEVAPTPKEKIQM